MYEEIEAIREYLDSIEKESIYQDAEEHKAKQKPIDIRQFYLNS